MFWRRSISIGKALQTLKDIQFRLAISEAQLNMGAKIRQDRGEYMNQFYRVSVPSAMIGFPITPLMMSNFYINEAFSNLKRSLKGMKKVLQALSGRYPFAAPALTPYMDQVKELERELTIIDNMEVNTALRELMNCISRAKELCSSIMATLNEMALELGEE